MEAFPRDWGCEGQVAKMEQVTCSQLSCLPFFSLGGSTVSLCNQTLLLAVRQVLAQHRACHGLVCSSVPWFPCPLLAGDGSQLGLTGTERPLEARESTAWVKLPRGRGLVFSGWGRLVGQRQRMGPMT